MSGAQVTPRPAPLGLALDKSLPPAPIDEDDSEYDTSALRAAAGRSSRGAEGTAPSQGHQTWAAPEGAAIGSSLQISAAQFDRGSPESDIRSLTPCLTPPGLAGGASTSAINLSSTPRPSRREMDASSASSIDPSSPLQDKKDSLALDQRAEVPLMESSHDTTASSSSPRERSDLRDSFVSASAYSPQTFFSPFASAADSPEGGRSLQTLPRSRSSSHERAGEGIGKPLQSPRPPSQPGSKGLTMHAVLRHNRQYAGEPSPRSVSSAPPPSDAAQGYFPSLPDPSSFPLPSVPRMVSSGYDTSAGHRISRSSARGASSHYSSDMSSIRNSTSTRGSLWTDKSQTSCNTSPGGLHSSLGFEPFPKVHDNRDGQAEETEEIDEQSVGLGITSDDEADTGGSRRSCAALVMPSTYIAEGSPALSGPFSHHRAPSWTRKSDLSNLAMLSFENRVGGALDPTRPMMNRTISELSPKEFERSMMEDRTVQPQVPFRKESRTRCSSEMSHHGHARNQSSISSTFSSHSNMSGHYSPAMASTADYSGMTGLTRTLSSSTCSSTFSLARPMRVNPQSPPRTSSLRQTESTSSLHSRHGSLSRTASARRKGLLHPDQSPSHASTSTGIDQRLGPAVELSGRPILLDAAEGGGEMPAATIKRTAASDTARRISDVSINSFLHGAEFSHVLGAYADRFKWDEDGLYDFDEAAETEDEDSQAVKTAQDGSAAIVHANGRDIAEIEKEAGPNTTHLVLRDCAQPDLLEMLERVLPSTQRLLVLDVSGCQLSRLPVSLGNCLSLEELDISRNTLAALPESISNLRALRVLSADGTGIQVLPSSFSNLQDLQCLSLRNNRLSHLPSWLHRLGKLDRLHLEGNPFKAVWYDIVAPLVTPPGEEVVRMPEESAGPAPASSPASVVSSATASVTSSPMTRRFRSIGDFHKPQLALDTSAPQSPDEESGRSSGVSPSSLVTSLHSSALDPNEGMRQFGFLAEGPTAQRPDSRRGSDMFEDGHGGAGKWGFLKKIGRKASSSRLGVMYTEHVNPSDSRTTSPKASRAALRSSSGASSVVRGRSGSTSGLGPRGAASPPPAKMDTVVETGLIIPAHTPMTPFSSSFPSPKPTATGSAASTLSGSSKHLKRRSFLPMQGFEAVQSSAMPETAARETETLDAEALAHHRQRLRALMHYLRDLDDLTSIRPSPSGSPSLKEQAMLRDVSNEGTPLIMTRNSSIASGDSSAPSSLLKSSASFTSTAASTPITEDVRIKRSSGAEGTEENVRDANAKDDSVRRVRIIEEIVRTEETYVKGVSELVEIYVKPAQLPADGQGGPPVVPMTEQRAVFGNVEAILRFHTDVFLPALRSAARPLLEAQIDLNAEGSSDFTASVAESVATVFTHHAAFFKMYMGYINNCDSAQNRINVWMAPSSVINAAATFKTNSLNSQHGSSGHSHGHSLAGTAHGYDFGLTPSQRKKIKAFMKRCRMHPRHAQLNVESYLLLPIQRIPRYRLLLEDLVRSTDPSRLSSADSLSTALEHVSRIASNVNESKRQSEQDRRLLSWQYRIRGSFESPLVQPHRRLIKDGPLRLRRTVKRVPGFIRQNRSVEAPPANATAVTDLTQIMQVDHLTQTSENLGVTLILCNDMMVVVTDPSQGRDAASPVHLHAILRLEKPVEIVGGVNLRIVDRKAVMYFLANSPDEAAAWKTALNAQLA